MRTKKARKLTETQKAFLADWGHLVRKWDVSSVAKMFGVSRQAVDYHINTSKEEYENT